MGGSSGSAVTPGAHVGASSAAVRATGTAGTPTVTAMLAAARGDQLSRVMRIPRLPRLRLHKLIIPFAIAALVWLVVVLLIGGRQMQAVLSAADLTSVVGALVVVQGASVGQGLALWGGVTTYIPFDALVRTASAMSFAELIGGPVASTAAAVSLHRRNGLTPSIAYSSGLLTSVARVAVALLLAIGFLPVAIGQLHLGITGPKGPHAALLQTLLLAGVATGLIGGLAFIAPRMWHAWASRVRPQFASAWAHVYDVTSHVAPVVRLLAGPALTQLLLAAGLAWCLHAVGAEANFSALMLVCCTASVLAGICPVPGGMGVVEATYISGLTLAGVPQDVAAGATLLFRACTTYVPALWGWVAFARLREEDL
ncbi:MAG TPA: YbhN family protein [Acidimicrobiales bacterium]|jgi:uncharacterized membrane protein YbhN (UPF0104 family)|nr:YbhN family protein [Acidimicrobiales bacterium]